MVFAGVDLHKRYLTLCILDPQGNVLREHRRLGTDALFAVLAEFDESISVAVESTLHWAWLHDELTARGYTVDAAHPAQVKLITRARCKTDPIDARKLADLLRTNLLPSIWVPDRATRANRKLLRGHAFLVKTRTRYKNRIHAHLADLNLVSPKTDLFGKQGRLWLSTLQLPEETRFQVDLLLEMLDELELRIRRLGRRIERKVEVTPEARLLKTVPGIGDKTGLLIWAEIGTLDRFPTSHRLCSYAGLVPTTRSSGGKTTHGSIPHTGNPWLRWALVEATHELKQHPGPVRTQFTKLQRSKGRSKATIAAARKLCCYLYWMLRDELTYPEWLRKRQKAHIVEVRPS
jgi:transposase